MKLWKMEVTNWYDTEGMAELVVMAESKEEALAKIRAFVAADNERDLRNGLSHKKGAWLCLPSECWRCFACHRWWQLRWSEKNNRTLWEGAAQEILEFQYADVWPTPVEGEVYHNLGSKY